MITIKLTQNIFKFRIINFISVLPSTWNQEMDALVTAKLRLDSENSPEPWEAVEKATGSRSQKVSCRAL